MTVELKKTLGKVTADKMTLNRISIMLMDMKDLYLNKAENEQDAEMKAVYERMAERHRTDSKFIYDALDAVGFYDSVKNKHK